MTYTVERLIPTMAGATVHVARDGDGRQVILKRPQTPQAARDLAAYARQLRRLGEIASIAGFYPPVLHLSDDLLVLPYYPYGSVDAAGAGDRAVFTRLVGRALDAVFAVSALHSLTATDHEYAGVEGARAFWRAQLAGRFDRLVRTGAPVDRPPFSAIAGWLDSGALDKLLGAAVTRPLALAAHGDFGLNNVLLASPVADDAELRFIDLRGQTPWARTLPWWDPILDLATLITFHCRIEPALGVRDGVAVSGPHDRAVLSPPEILASSAGLAGWSADDTGWELRLRLGIVTRLLGSVSVQLTSAPEQGEERARRVTSLLADAVEELGC